MANVFIYKNENLKHIEEFLTTALAAAVKKGDIVMVGGKPGIYDDDYPIGTTVVTVSRGGQFRAAITDVTGASAPVAVGTAVYITSAGALTLTATSNTLVGYVAGNDPLTGGGDVLTIEWSA
jgi:predicted RecA/RadA family phage recombinase